MEDFCTTMTVVPAGGKLTPPLLGCGPAVLPAFGDALPAFVVACAVALDPATVAWSVLEAEFDELDEPPHAASSSTSDPSPVAAANPLLRMYVSPFARMTRSWAVTAGERHTKERSRAVMLTAPGTLAPARAQPVTMSLAESLMTCHCPPTPFPDVVKGLAPLNVYSGRPL